MCSFGAIDIGSEGTILNGLFVFNLSINLEQFSCEKAEVSLFGNVDGIIKNLSAVGFINISSG